MTAETTPVNRFRKQGSIITVYELRDVLDNVIYVGSSDVFPEARKAFHGLLKPVVIQEFSSFKKAWELQAELNKKYSLGWNGWPNWEKSPTIAIVGEW